VPSARTCEPFFAVIIRVSNIPETSIELPVSADIASAAVLVFVRVIELPLRAITSLSEGVIISTATRFRKQKIQGSFLVRLMESVPFSLITSISFTAFSVPRRIIALSAPSVTVTSPLFSTTSFVNGVRVLSSVCSYEAFL
jgi:hypothetical protein